MTNLIKIVEKPTIHTYENKTNPDVQYCLCKFF